MAASARPLILVADAAEESRSATGSTLAAEGYDVLPASGGDEALASLAQRRPDLVILDAGLPDKDGFEVCAAIKQDPHTRSLAVIIVTDSSQVADCVRAMDTGADDFLQRPIEPVELLARVRSLLRVKAGHDEMAAEIRRFTQIGIALSAERNLNRLLERIVDEARAINHADGGTLYLSDWDANVNRYEIMQNASMGTRMGGESGERIPFPPVTITPDNVSGYVALTGKILNIPDVYEAEGFDFSGPRKFDAATGYRSMSMLAVPMRNHQDEVIGVVQLINAQDPATGKVVPFFEGNVQRTVALASQAGIAITNARLIQELEAFLEGLIQVMAAAVDEKSHYTAGHIQRVTRLSVVLAEALNAYDGDEFGGQKFTADELKEIRIAGLLHDIGKIVVPEHIVDKATKLQTVYDRMAEVRTRFLAVRRSMEADALRRKLALLEAGAPREQMARVDAELAEGLQSLSEDLEFISGINPGGEFMAPEKLERLHAIAAKTYVDGDGKEQPFLTENEVRNLSIPRGTLLPEEFAMIRAHAAVSARLLSQIPFAKRLRRVPVFAGDHHEALDGSGYPAGKAGDELALQSRILAVADIYDALTSSDRPYKPAFSQERAYKILREDASRGKLDSRLVELFISADCAARAQQA